MINILEKGDYLHSKFSINSIDDIKDISNNFRYHDDIWNLKPFINNINIVPISNRKLDFNNFPDSFKEIIKLHSFYELGRIKPQSVAHRLNIGKSKFLVFIKEFNIKSFAEFNTELFLFYINWLEDKYIKKASLTYHSMINLGKKKETKTYKPLSRRVLYFASLWLKQLLDNAVKYNWEGKPSNGIVLELPLSKIWDESREKNLNKMKEESQKRVIPNIIWNKIINFAKNESKFQFGKSRGDKYQLIYKSGEAKGIKAVNFVKYGILIQAFTGLRISEVITLKRGCVFKDSNNRKWLRRELNKTVIEPKIDDIRIPNEIYESILELEHLTLDYYKRTKLNNLFFSVSPSQGNKISRLSSFSWNEKYLSIFMKRNNIIDHNGNLYKVRSHDFRHTFASKLVNEWNVPLSVLTKHYGHVSKEMTMHYVKISKEKILSHAVKSFTEASKIISNGEMGEQFIKVINEAKIENNLDNLINKLTDSFGISSLPFGICLYDYRRGHCPNIGVSSCWEIGCNNFVTSNRFLYSFKHEKEILENQIRRDEKIGKIIEVKKKKIKYDKVISYIKKMS